MAAPKCRYHNKQVDKQTAFKIVIKDKNTYWCCEECYNLYFADKERQDKIKAEYDEIFEITKEIFGYEFAGYSMLKKEVSTWEKLSTRQKIIAYLNDNKAWLSTTMSKSFANDYNRVRYYSTIIASKLHDYQPRVEIAERPKVVVEETIYEAPTHTLNKRRSLADLEDDF